MKTDLGKTCQNGIDFDECEKQVDAVYYPYCEDCGIANAEQAMENMIESYFGGSQAFTIKEKQVQAKRLK